MTQVSTQYAVGQKLTKPFPTDMRVIGYETIADVDASEAPYSADYTITSGDQAVAFLVLTTATAGTMAVTLYHGTTHAAQVDTAALIRAGNDGGFNIPAATITLDLTKVEDRKAVIIVNPAGRQMSGSTIVAWTGTTNKVSLKLTADGSYSDGSTVQVVCLGAYKRFQPGPQPS